MHPSMNSSILLLLVWSTQAISVSTLTTKPGEKKGTRLSLPMSNHDMPSYVEGFNRRSFLGLIPLGLTMAASSPAVAKDELFKTNPLTSPVLEQMRIWDQAAADNLKYDGELEKGDAGNKGQVSAYTRLLVPILKIQKELIEVQTLVHNAENKKQSWQKALAILQQDQYQKVNFKKTFNAYGDNIYFSDPDRANVYLGGGAAPKPEQSMAYLLRNDVLTNIENLTAELEYLLKEDDDVEDLYSYADTAVGAMKNYIGIVPPNELEAATQLLSNK